MNNVSQVKTRIEGIHIDYLCNNFDLKRTQCFDFGTERLLRPDLHIDKNPPSIFFEMKSRMFPKEQNGLRYRPISDFSWWPMWGEQINNYTEFANNNNLKLYWIFILGQCDKNISESENVEEKLVKHRDIYVLPWNVHELVQSTSSGNKYLGLNRLKKEFSFENQEVENGKLYVPTSIVSDISQYFY